MATKTPGVYLEEIDSTNFLNIPSNSSAVGMIGFSSKGPIGVPTLIRSNSEFREVFGKPTVLANSSIAARDILSSGAQLLFTRVADSTATPSNRIVKNGVQASNGKTLFNKREDILTGTANYAFKSIYAFNARAFDEDVYKTFFIRSPLNSKLTQSSIISQISQQIAATPARQEILGMDYGASAGTYSFSVELDGTNVFADPSTEGIFVNLQQEEKGQLLAEKISQSINEGSNSTAILNLVRPDGSTGNYLPLDPNANLNMGEYQFRLLIDGNTATVPISIVDEQTISTFASLLTDALRTTYGVDVYFEMEPSVYTRLVFVNRFKGANKSIDVAGIKDENGYASNKDLFYSTTTNGTANLADFGKIPTNQPIDTTGIFVAQKTVKSNIMLGDIGFDVIYNVSTNSILFQTKETGSQHSIQIVQAPHGNYLLKPNASNVSPIGIVLNPVDGQDSTDLSIYKSANKDIIFESNNSIELPKIVSAIDANTDSSGIDAPIVDSQVNGINFYKDFISLMKGTTEIQGNVNVDSLFRDIIVISSREKGSGTADLQVRKYTLTNPLTGEVSYNIDVSKNGTFKENFSNVSLKYTDLANRFDTKINEEPENGGSALVTIEVIKNDFDTDLIQWKDGYYSVGSSDNAEDVLKTADISLDAYNYYDYSVGTDGIPEDGGDDLFEDVLKVEGELSDINLYNFNILVTPDNISSIVQDAAIALANSRQDFVYIADPPFGLTPKGAADWHNGKGFGRGVGLDSSYAIVYYPWIKTYDADNRRYSWVPPSTLIPGKLVAIDNAKGSYAAPAGETNGRFNVGDIEYSAKQFERDLLYANYNRINPIIKYNDGSIIIFGEKTCQRDTSTLTKIHVRRMVVDLKKKVRASLRPFLFLPNIPANWAKMASLINSILEVYKQGGGLLSYSTVIDSSTTTGDLIQQDICKGVIHIVPAGVLEQIDLSISIDKPNDSVSVEG